MSSTTLIASVHDSLQSLNRIVSLLRGRNFAIDSLTLARSERPGIARMTLGLRAPARPLRVVSCLDKLEEVLTVSEANPSDVIRREAALVKVTDSPAIDGWITALPASSPARVAERGRGTVVFEVFGDPEVVEDAIASLPEGSVVECARVGQFAISR